MVAFTKDKQRRIKISPLELHYNYFWPHTLLEDKSLNTDHIYIAIRKSFALLNTFELPYFLHLQIWPLRAALALQFPRLRNMAIEMLRLWGPVHRKGSACAHPRCIKARLGVGFIVQRLQRGWNDQNQCLPTTLWLLFLPKNLLNLPKGICKKQNTCNNP